MVKDGEDKHQDHQNQRADSAYAGSRIDGEQANQRDLSEVQADEQLLKGSWVDATLGIDSCVGNEHEVVSEHEVEEVQTDCGESKDQRRDCGIANRDNEQVGIDR